MFRFRFAIYPPAGPDFPWLAVTMDREKIADTFACPSKEAAESVMAAMKARWSAKNGRAYS